jgi:ATP-dependent protease ClpP protease subunit
MFWSCASLAKTFEIRGPIDEMKQETVALLMLEVAKKPKTIEIPIDSPGGYVHIGFQFLDAIYKAQKQGTKVICTLDGKMAASMAAIIFSQCDERKAIANSFILFHSIATFLPGFFGVVINIPTAKALLKELQHDQAIIDKLVRQNFVVNDEMYAYLNDNEVFFGPSTANQLSPGFITKILPARADLDVTSVDDMREEIISLKNLNTQVDNRRLNLKEILSN